MRACNLSPVHDSVTDPHVLVVMRMTMCSMMRRLHEVRISDARTVILVRVQKSTQCAYAEIGCVVEPGVFAGWVQYHAYHTYTGYTRFGVQTIAEKIA